MGNNGGHNIHSYIFGYGQCDRAMILAVQGQD